MSLASASQFLERIRFFDGQRLFASDLQALESFHREMRWLHNQSLHQPGVGSGFAVAGMKGDREVVIRTGYAIDDLGREIVLTQDTTLPIPPVAGDGYGRSVFFDLTVSYPDESLLRPSETREGVCNSDPGTVRLMEQPIFCWVRLGRPPERLPENTVLSQEVQRGRRLRLARAEVLQCRLEQPLSIAQRRNARPPTQPYIACGVSDAAAWEVAHNNFGYQLAKKVDTSSGKFRTAPSYSAQVSGNRTFVFKDGATNAAFPIVLDGFLTIEPDPTTPATLFGASVLVPGLFAEPLLASGHLTPAQVAAQMKTLLSGANDWRVQWMGVES